ncbi:MAG: hypothetical protein KKC84_06925 [Candidatus Omnitrophica bacterium]|nr:hypothetical protein [Candidatus Omnitrophota bacterium]
MKLPKFVFVISLITFFSILYVYQQVEVFRLAYVVQKRQFASDDLLDRNILLRYNIRKKASLVRLGDKMTQMAEFQMPDNFRLVRFSLAPDTLHARRAGSFRKTFLTRVFTSSQQPEAKFINP